MADKHRRQRIRVATKGAGDILTGNEPRLRTLVENSSDIVSLVSAKGIILYASPSVSRLLGYPITDFVRQDASEFVHPEDREAARLLFQSQKPGATATAAFRVRKSDGSWLWMQGVGTNLLADPSVGAIVTRIRDITEYKQAEEKILKLNTEVESLVESRTTHLHRAMKDLEAFSYSVAHDLRAPLRAIEGFSRMLDETQSNLLEAEGRRLISMIRRNVSRMDGLINDVLAFSKMARLQLDSQKSISFRRMVHAVVAEFRSSTHNVTFHVGALPDVECHTMMIRQVWFNLISNAVKFTGSRPDPRIDIGCTTDGDTHTFFVKDNGIGFDTRHADAVFGHFHRLHPPEEYEGSGVGLAIVQRIVHRHGGRVWAVSRPGEGATFFFTLPRQTVPA